MQGICSEGKPWKVDLKLPNGDSLRQLLLDHGYAQEEGESPPTTPEVEDDEANSDDETGSSVMSSSAISSGAVSSDAVGSSDPRQIVALDVVPDEDEDNVEDAGDAGKFVLAGVGMEYGHMRLPDVGVYFGAQVTQVDQPDLVSC